MARRLRKPASRVRVGMRADDVLKLRGRAAKDAVAPVSVISEGEDGLIVQWYYADCTVMLARKDGPYRVLSVTEAGAVN